MDPSHINPLKLQQLEERMRNGKLPSKPQATEIKVHGASERENNTKMEMEFPLQQKGKVTPLQTLLQSNNANEHLDSSDKENTKGMIDLEASEKFVDLKPETGLIGIKPEENPGNVSLDISYQSAGPSVSKSQNKRKHNKLDQIIESNDDYEMTLKKPKLTVDPPVGGEAYSGDRADRGDSFGTLGENDLNVMSKEAPMAIIGTKKITEFFKLKDGGSVGEKSTQKISANKTKIKSTVEKTPANPEMIKEVAEDKKELYNRIKDLEDRLENNRKDREREHIKAENELNNYKEQFNKYQTNVQKILARHVIEIESHKRIERKSFLNRQRQRLGEYVSQREGSKFVDVWSDGFEMRSIKEKLENIIKEKEELEKQKKNLKQKKMPASGAKVGAPSEANTNADSNSNIDIKEAKERIIAKVTMLQREENFLREQLEKLEEEKVVFYQLYKKQYEEDHSRYGRPNPETNAPAWPILSDRYQLLSLLGKGGFSEVYKAYDLQELIETACKVHQLNPNWTENAKTNYVKHANREFEVHKELNHPNIVRLFDCISIDDHSFATILDYCEGPDLSTYLKQHKILPEKDAKVIIKQIVAGLKYLNDHKTKIIHYDLKPQNVMFHKGEIKISDFGLCKIVDPDVSRIELTSQGVGTYWYLPPECFVMDDQPPLINNKVDIWSVGVMYYEMLYGMRPFGHNMSQEKILKEQVILKSYNVNFPVKPVVSSEAKDFIKKCLAYNQESRIDVHEAYDILYNIKK